MRSIIIAAAVLISSGCASMSGEEIALQTLHAADVAQTLQIAKNPCRYYEKDPITARLIGEHPSEDAVIAWGVASAVGLHWISQKADDAGGWQRVAWYAAAIAFTGKVVIGNKKIGISVDGVDHECD